MQDIFITKASGEQTKFSEEKLKISLEKAGANKEQINAILKEINLKLYDGISTKKIYRLAFMLLQEGSRHLAARYHLKKAIMELGPSGFPFEKYISEILNVKGFKTKVGQILQGTCITHEVDVLAEKENAIYMIECKYHNQSGKFSDVQVPLYIQSRFKDLESNWLKLPQHKEKKHYGWVITNTRFSTDAIKYGTCIGLHLLSWDYPLKDSLKDQIDTLGLYPITCLTSLTKIEKQKLLDEKIVLCKELYNNSDLLYRHGIKATRINIVLKEVEQLCKHLITHEAKR